jgi:hypothetical protein
MDPTALWKRIRENMEFLQGGGGEGDLRDELAEDLKNLAAWIYRGGFPPTLEVDDG